MQQTAQTAHNPQSYPCIDNTTSNSTTTRVRNSSRRVRRTERRRESQPLPTGRLTFAKNEPFEAQIAERQKSKSRINLQAGSSRHLSAPRHAAKYSGCCESLIGMQNNSFPLFPRALPQCQQARGRAASNPDDSDVLPCDDDELV